MVVHEQEAGVDLAVELCGLRLRTPLIPASGTLSREALGEVGGVYGAMLPKTTTPVARAGNPPPRIAETPAGMVNSIGLQNPGVEDFLQGLDAFDLGIPIFVSVAGDTIEEFSLLCEPLAGEARVSAVELSLSGPAIKPVALRAVYDVSGAVNIPVIGSGGVVSGTDVAEFMLAGATAVQVGTASFVRDPHEILDEFASYLKESGLGAAELSGALRSVPR